MATVILNPVGCVFEVERLLSVYNNVKFKSDTYPHNILEGKNVEWNLLEGSRYTICVKLESGINSSNDDNNYNYSINVDREYKSENGIMWLIPRTTAVKIISELLDDQTIELDL